MFSVKKSLTFIWIITICSLTISMMTCSTDPVLHEEDIDKRYYLYCLLNPALETQQVLLGVSLPESRPQDISDANIQISSISQSAFFKYTGHGIYKNSDPIKIMAGEPYLLSVTLTNGKRFSGKTIVPGIPHIRYPANGDTLEYYALSFPDTSLYPRIHWEKASEAFFYSVFLDFRGRLEATTFQLYKTTTLLPEYRPSTISATNHEIIPATLYIFAHDSSQVLTAQPRFFKNYSGDLTSEEMQLAMENVADPFTPQKLKAKNINCDMGSFGSMSMDSCKLYLRIHLE